MPITFRNDNTLKSKNKCKISYNLLQSLIVLLFLFILTSERIIIKTKKYYNAHIGFIKIRLLREMLTLYIKL